MTPSIRRFWFVLFYCLGVSNLIAAPLPTSKEGAYLATKSFVSENATQAAVADEKYVYSISNSVIIKHDRETGKEVAKSTGEAAHLNSGYFWDGKMYCAHSNYPKKPDESDLRILDPETMKLTLFHEFKNPPGSLTWAVRKDKDWWCCFAHYKVDNHKTVLIRYDENWKEKKRYSFPEKLINDWEEASLSGGIWEGDHILATGHDREVIYKLKLPEKGTIIQLVEVIACPFAGQAFATDPKTGGLIGIHRKDRKVVFAKYEK